MPGALQRRQQFIDVGFTVGGREREAEPRAAGGHGRRPDRATQNPSSNSAWLRRSARAASPTINGWIGLRESNSGRPSSGRAAHEVATTSACSCSRRQLSRCAIRKRRARRRGDARRQRRGVDVGARALQDQFDHVRIAGDEGAEAAEGLAQRADQQRHGAGVEARQLERARARASPSTPRPCASSTSSQARCRAASRRQLAQRRDVAVHAEQAVGGDQRAVRAMPASACAAAAASACAIAQQPRAGQPCAVDQRGVVEPVLQHALVAAGQAPTARRDWPCSRWRTAARARGPVNAASSSSSA